MKRGFGPVFLWGVAPRPGGLSPGYLGQEKLGFREGEGEIVRGHFGFAIEREASVLGRGF